MLVVTNHGPYARVAEQGRPTKTKLHVITTHFNELNANSSIKQGLQGTGGQRQLPCELRSTAGPGSQLIEQPNAFAGGQGLRVNKAGAEIKQLTGLPLSQPATGPAKPQPLPARQDWKRARRAAASGQPTNVQRASRQTQATR